MSDRIAELEAEVERLRQLTRMDLHDAREWVESLKRVAAQRDRLAEALVKHREWFDEVLNLAAGDLDWGLTGSALKVLEDALEDLEQPMPGRARALLSRDEAADRIAELEVDQ